MINQKRVIAVITARGGSKGVLRKNVRLVGNKPLIAWTIEAAHSSKYIDRTIVSTDDDEIAEVAEKHGAEVPFRRPKELAGDASTSIDVLLHALKEAKEDYEYIILLQPTSPLRSSLDIDNAVQMCSNDGVNSCVSVVESSKHPLWMYYLNARKELMPVLANESVPTRRQDLPAVYVLNGAVYVARTKDFVKSRTFLGERSVAYIMPPERSLDIDSEFDLKIADFLLSKPYLSDDIKKNAK